MRDKVKEMWYLRNTLENLDVLEEVKNYMIVAGFKNYHTMIFNGELSLVLDKGISSYCFVPDVDSMSLLIYKRDNLNLKKKDKWWLKKEIIGDDCWWVSIKWVSNGKDV
ncbi:MAG: hypothetical protein ACRDDY_19470 [Clostridium sp.]|uniref:hypothetical protein n=1 Tax=Clostridium sp. TaxID=1506 RepID=UPI003EE72387